MKHSRKIFLILALLIVGCTRQDKPEDDKPYIVFAAPFDNHPVWDKAKNGFFSACDDFNVRCEWKGPEFISTDFMEKTLHEAIMKKADGVITQGVVNPDVLALADEASIPFVLVDSDIPASNRIQSFVKNFDYQASLLVNHIHDHLGNIPMRVAIQVAEMDFDIAKEQIEAFKRTMNSLGGEHKVIVVSESKSDPIKARARWREVLKSDPNINVVVNFAGESAQEAAIVTEELGLQNILIYGVDEMSETIELIKEGKVQGTIITSFYDYGYNAVHVLYNHIMGKPNDEEALSVTIGLLTKESMEAYENQRS